MFRAMAEEKKTASDVLQQVGELIKKAENMSWTSFGKTAVELEGLLDQLRQVPELCPRLPLALVSEDVIKPDGSSYLSIMPHFCCEVEHIVVSPACKDFRFNLFTGVMLEGASIDMLPASIFVSNAQGEALDRLFVNRWKTNKIHPGVHLRMHVLNNGDVPARFEAVAWVRVVRP
jgi:hypothetical protein